MVDDDRSQIFGIDKDYVILGVMGVAGWMLFVRATTDGNFNQTNLGKEVFKVAPPLVGGAAAVITYPFANFVSSLSNQPIAQNTPTFAQDYPGYSATSPWDTFRLGWNISTLGGTWALR